MGDEKVNKKVGGRETGELQKNKEVKCLFCFLKTCSKRSFLVC